MTRYEPADSFETPRFSGVRTFMRLPNTQDLQNADAAIVGAPFDTGSTFRAGARFGPEGIRSASHLLRRYNPSLGVVIFDYLSVIDYGDVPVAPGYIAASYEKLSEGLEPIHRVGVVPVVLDGDHAIALPELRAAAAVHGPLALVQFDSHPGTWDSYFGQRLWSARCSGGATARRRRPRLDPRRRPGRRGAHDPGRPPGQQPDLRCPPGKPRRLRGGEPPHYPHPARYPFGLEPQGDRDRATILALEEN